MFRRKLVTLSLPLGAALVVLCALPSFASYLKVPFAEIAVPFLERGTPVLVEKPMSRTIADADRMIAAAAAGTAVLAVGHTERHNPAVAIALRLVAAPRFIEVHRLSGFPERSLDIDVIFDVMIHDLDIILAVDKSDVVGVEAVGVPVLTPKINICNARVKFASGCIANITASRISRVLRYEYQPPASRTRSRSGGRSAEASVSLI